MTIIKGEELTSLSVRYCKIQKIFTQIWWQHFSWPLVYAGCQSVMFLTFINAIMTVDTVGHPNPANETPTANGPTSHNPLSLGQWKGVLPTVSCGCAYWRVDGREWRWLRETSAIRTVLISVYPLASPIMPDHAAILNYVIASRRMSRPQKPPCSRLRADSHYTSRFCSVTVPSPFRRIRLCSHGSSCSVTFQNGTW